MSELVTLVNRSTKTLKGTWDGRHYDIGPGRHEFAELKAMKFRDQNPVMGSEDPYSGEKKYLMGIVEHGDDITPVEQSDSISLQDLSEKIRSGEYKVVKGNGLYRPMQDAPSTPAFTPDLNFVKP
jgi:hypothetical protein